MPILNYTTSIDVMKSAIEVQHTLAKAGADEVRCKYEDKIPVSISFSIEMNGVITLFSLPANWSGVLRQLENDKKVERRFKNKEQAARVAWRILKDWVEAQCAIIESGMVDLPEVFLPYAITVKGSTLYQELKASNNLLLTEGK